MTTAKENFDHLVSTNRSMPETSKKECEQKVAALEQCVVTFSTGWLVFWFFFGWGIGFIICLILGISNNSKRTDYKNSEISKLQMKISNFPVKEPVKKAPAKKAPVKKTPAKKA